jgi:hypothetical protein
MAVKAEFQADFTSFQAGVDKADAKLQAFGKSAEKTSAATSQWSKALGQADSILAQSGIHVGSAAKALDELTAVSGKSVAELGAVGTAASLAGAALAGWEFGRAIAGWLGTDDAIGNATASLLGYASVADEIAGAQQDTITKALSLGATAGISYAAAIAFITEKEKARLKVVKEQGEAQEKTKEAMVELNSAGVGWAGTLDTIDGATVEAIKHYLEAGVSQAALATAYGLTAVQVKAVAESLKAAEAADKAWLEGMKAAAAEAELYRDVLARLASDGIDKTTTANDRAVAALSKKTDAITASILAESAARESLNRSTQTYDSQTTAWMKMTQQLAELERQKVGDIDTTARQQVIYNEYTDTLLREARAQDAATAATRNAPAALDATAAATGRATQAAGVFMNQLHMLVDDPKLAAFFGGGAQGAVATTLFSGGQGGITPEMAAAMAAGQVINTAGVGAIHNTFNVNGTATDVARQISTELMRTLKAGGKVASS